VADDVRAVTTPLRIRITNPALWWDLLQSLATGGCSAVRLPDGTVEVTHHSAADDREARVELAFFVRAWQTKHPDVTAEVIG
jgi:hypothetical protein